MFDAGSPRLGHRCGSITPPVLSDDAAATPQPIRAKVCVAADDEERRPLAAASSRTDAIRCRSARSELGRIQTAAERWRLRAKELSHTLVLLLVQLERLVKLERRTRMSWRSARPRASSSGHSCWGDCHRAPSRLAGSMARSGPRYSTFGRWGRRSQRRRPGEARVPSAIIADGRRGTPGRKLARLRIEACVRERSLTLTACGGLAWHA